VPSLKPGVAAEGAELWVLRDDPINEPEHFVQNAADACCRRLAFAVGEHDGKANDRAALRQVEAAAPVLGANADATSTI